LNAGIRVINNTFNRPIQEAHPQINTLASVNTSNILTEIATIIWITGILLILSYGVISYFRLKHRLSAATIVKENIFETDRIQTPFVLGLVKPRIYIPIGLSDSELEYIIKHEQIHIRRCDYIIKPTAFLALTLHWFNPLIWISYFLMVKDMEMSCDESVMKESGYDIRTRYSNSLLNLSVKQSRLLSPLAFGESNKNHV
jgi:beta-lactamase regulating signal transducer with metallopeptidase domain